MTGYFLGICTHVWTSRLTPYFIWLTNNWVNFWPLSAGLVRRYTNKSEYPLLHLVDRCMDTLWKRTDMCEKVWIPLYLNWLIVFWVLSEYAWTRTYKPEYPLFHTWPTDVCALSGYFLGMYRHVRTSLRNPYFISLTSGAIPVYFLRTCRDICGQVRITLLYQTDWSLATFFTLWTRIEKSESHVSHLTDCCLGTFWVLFGHSKTRKNKS